MSVINQRWKTLYVQVYAMNVVNANNVIWINKWKFHILRKVLCLCHIDKQLMSGRRFRSKTNFTKEWAFAFLRILWIFELSLCIMCKRNGHNLYVLRFCTMAFLALQMTEYLYAASFKSQGPLKCCKIINMVCSEMRRLQSNHSLKKMRSFP